MNNLKYKISMLFLVMLAIQMMVGCPANEIPPPIQPLPDLKLADASLPPLDLLSPDLLQPFDLPTVIDETPTIDQPIPVDIAPPPDFIMPSDLPVGWMEVPSNGLTQSEPAAISETDGTIFLYVRDVGSGDIWENIRRDNVWTNWSRVLGKETFSSPCPVQDRDRNIHLIVKGADNLIWESIFNLSTSTWNTTWTLIPGLSVGSGLSAVRRYPRMYLFARGVDNLLYQTTHDGAAWSGWTSISTSKFTFSEPSAVLYTNSALWLFIRTPANQIEFSICTIGNTGNCSWGNWQLLPGQGLTQNRPWVVRDRLGQLRLYVRGMDNKIYENIFTTSDVWSGWGEIAGMQSLSGPTAVQDKDMIRVFVRGLDNKIYTILL